MPVVPEAVMASCERLVPRCELSALSLCARLGTPQEACGGRRGNIRR